MLKSTHSKLNHCRIGIAGTGFISKAIAEFLPSINDIKLQKVLTHRDIRSCQDYPFPNLLTNSTQELLDNCDIVIECSGHVLHAAEVIQQALLAKKPVITLNSEFHVTCGSYFKEQGLLTEGHGDQPGVLAELNENALLMGFNPLVFGNIKGFYDPNPTAEHMAFWSKKNNLSIPMATSSTDGTKLQVEQALIANGLGATIAQEGMLGIKMSDLNKVSCILGEKSKQLGQKIADYIVAPESRSRVFIVAEHSHEQKDKLAYLKFGNGPFYILKEHILLCHLELVKTIRRILNGGGILLDNGARPTISVAAVAKKDLKKGTLIKHGLGGFEVRGVAVKIMDKPDHIPIGLLYDVVLTKNIEAGATINFSDVDIAPSLALKGYETVLKKALAESGQKVSLPPRLSGVSTEINRCRICNGEIFNVLDLGAHPFANALLPSPEIPIEKYPLCLQVCKSCANAQLSYCADDKNLYGHYNYITPDSQMLKEHYAKIYSFLKNKGYIDKKSKVLEIGSNIGRFLEFMKPHVKSVLGVDPAINIAQMANKRGVPTINDFFNIASAKKILEKKGTQDLIVARHCFAHNQSPWYMLEGVKLLLSARGVFLIENAYFLDTVLKREFDQIYHEHMYYYTLRSIQWILKNYGLSLVDVMHSPIHGGTMLYAVKHNDPKNRLSPRAKSFLNKEKLMHQKSFYKDFIRSTENNKTQLNKLIRKLKNEKAVIHAYGACAKSTTLLNYYGITQKDVPLIVDSTTTKHNKFIPQANIRVISEEEAREIVPDYYLLTIWNYKDEVIKKVRGWGNSKTKFILPHPEVEIVT